MHKLPALLQVTSNRADVRFLAAEQPMLEARKLVKYYGNRPAVQGVSFLVGEGETVGFLGANGAGKSTTMRMLTGYLAPTSGRAVVGGVDVRERGVEARRLLGYLPENTPLYREMRVHEFLLYRAALKGIPYRRRHLVVDECLQRCGVAQASGRVIGHLSKGYRQRVGLADCLLGRPPILILDEPTVGLDPNQVVETRNLIREIGRERTVFLSTHILHEVELICGRVLIINQGRLVAEGTTAELCERYARWRDLFLEIAVPENPAAVFQGMRGVKSVLAQERLGRDTWRLTLRCSRGADPRLEIARLLSDKGWLLQEMRLEPIRLEDIFARLTADNGRHDDGDADAGNTPARSATATATEPHAP